MSDLLILLIKIPKYHLVCPINFIKLNMEILLPDHNVEGFSLLGFLQGGKQGAGF